LPAKRSTGGLVPPIEHNNANPKPFVWTKSANDIILKVNRGRAALKKPPLVRRDQL
jgi:hypothetical protein